MGETVRLPPLPPPGSGGGAAAAVASGGIAAVAASRVSQLLGRGRGGGGGAAPPPAPSRQVFQEGLASGTFSRVRGDGGTAGGAAGTGGGGGGGGDGAPPSPATAYLRARATTRATGGFSLGWLGGGGGDGGGSGAAGEGAAREDPTLGLPAGDTLFSPTQGLLEGATALAEGILAGLLLALVIQLARLPDGTPRTFLSTYGPQAPDLRFVQYVLSVAALVGGTEAALRARGALAAAARDPDAPPPHPAAVSCARYLAANAAAHAVVVATVLAGLPFDDTLHSLALTAKAAAGGGGGGGGGYDWGAVAADTYGATAATAWKVLVCTRFVAAAVATLARQVAVRYAAVAAQRDEK